MERRSLQVSYGLVKFLEVTSLKLFSMKYLLFVVQGEAYPAVLSQKQLSNFIANLL